MSLPTRCMPVLMLDQNDRLGRPRAEEPHDLIGTLGAGVEGDSATRFRALVRRHSIALPQTFQLATPAFYGSSGRSRIDFVATFPSLQFSRIFINFTAGRPDPTRGRWDHEKIEEMLSDPVARLTFFKELETNNSQFVVCGTCSDRGHS